MKKILILALALIIAGIQGLFAQPKISIFPSTTLDMGELVRGQKADRLVTITNTGNDTLRIMNVHATCGCTAALLKNDKTNLGPNDSTQVSISFNSQGQNGKVFKTVTIASNDTSNPAVTIQFTANVIAALGIDREMLSFSRIILDSVYNEVINLTNPSKDRGIKILSTTTTVEGMKVTLLKNTLMPGEQTQMQIKYCPPKSGVLTGTIDITTDHPLQSTSMIKVLATVNRK
jgi:hypothetical protein